MSFARVLTASVLMVLASTALWTSAKAEEFPDAEAIQDTLRRPRIESCDELTCYYRLGDWYSVRDIRCEAHGEDRARCSYERTVNRPWEALVLPSEVPVSPTMPTWAAVETTFKRVTESRWIVVADNED